MDLKLAMQEITPLKNAHALYNKLLSTKNLIKTFNSRTKSEDALLLRKASFEFKEEIKELDNLLARQKITHQYFTSQLAKFRLYTNGGGDTTKFIQNIERYKLRPSDHINDNIEPVPATGVAIASLVIAGLVLRRAEENAANEYNVVLEQTSRKTEDLFKKQQEFLISHVLSHGTLNLSEALYGIKLHYESVIIHILSKIKELEDMMKGMNGALSRDDWKQIIPHISPIIKDKFKKYEIENLTTLTTILIDILSSNEIYREIEIR